MLPKFNLKRVTAKKILESKNLLLVPDIPIISATTHYNKIIINENIASFYNLKTQTNILFNIKNKHLEQIESIDYKNYDKLNISRETLTYSLVSTISTCLDIWSHALPYDINDMCNSLTRQINMYIKNYGISTDLTKNGWTFSHNNTLITLEEVIRTIPVNAPLEEILNNSSLDIPEQWKCEKKLLKKRNEENIYSVVPHNTVYFYPCAYICPNCNRVMNKILLKNSFIIVHNEEREINKAFSCKYCNEFYAPLMYCTLDCGLVYHLRVNKKRYKEIITEMDKCGRERRF